jgi:hypothetical protein
MVILLIGSAYFPLRGGLTWVEITLLGWNRRFYQGFIIRVLKTVLHLTNFLILS